MHVLRLAQTPNAGWRRLPTRETNGESAGEVPVTLAIHNTTISKKQTTSSCFRVVQRASLTAMWEPGLSGFSGQVYTFTSFRRGSLKAFS